MAMMEKVEPREVFMGRLSYGGDFMEEITDTCRKGNIQPGWIGSLRVVYEF